MELKATMLVVSNWIISQKNQGENKKNVETTTYGSTHISLFKSNGFCRVTTILENPWHAHTVQTHVLSHRTVRKYSSTYPEILIIRSSNITQGRPFWKLFLKKNIQIGLRKFSKGHYIPKKKKNRTETHAVHVTSLRFASLCLFAKFLSTRNFPRWCMDGISPIATSFPRMSTRVDQLINQQFLIWRIRPKNWPKKNMKMPTGSNGHPFSRVFRGGGTLICTAAIWTQQSPPLLWHKFLRSKNLKRNPERSTK